MGESLIIIGGAPTPFNLWTGALSTNDSNSSAQSLRNLHVSPAANFSQVRLTISNSTAAACAADHVSVGIRTGSASDTVATPVEVLFGGVAGFSLSAGGTIVSDWVSLSGTTSSVIVSIFDITSGAQGRRFGSNSGNNIYARDTFDSYNQATVTGFTLISNRTYLVSLIEGLA